MPRTGKTIPLVPLQRFFQEQGGKRISKDSLEVLSDHLENLALRVSKQAIIFMEHSGRKTLRKEDIRSADKVDNIK